MKSDTPHPPSGRGQEPPPEPPALPAGESLHRLVFDHLPGMAYLGRADRARTIELASAGAGELLGFDPAQKPFALTPLIHPDERDQVFEVVKAAVAEHRPFAVEYRLRHAGGGWRTVWEQGRPVRRGQHVSVQGHLMDVTHRLHLEQARLAMELRQLHAQKFQALNQLAGGVAHEFNNLVAGILGSAELLAMDLSENHPGHATLRQIFEASNLARDFVHKLRAVGQRPLLEFKLIHLPPLIEECLQILRTIIPPRVELSVSLAPDCPEVQADATQLHQAILELCLHAWQGLADRRGRIQIGLELRSFVHPPAGAASLLKPGPHVCLTVQDDSPGLDKNALEHMFHPFRSRRAGGKKIGLELFLVRETIQAHQGDIFMESGPGQGLTFRIYLPVTEGK